MRRSRKFCHRGSNSDKFFLVVEGRRIQIPLVGGHHWPASETPFQWCFSDGPMIAQLKWGFDDRPMMTHH